MVPVGEVVEGLARTMEKIHRDKALTVTVRAEGPVSFRGERNDLEEMVGNLVDNACKWADSEVSVAIARETAASAVDRAFFTVTIEDDGPGLSASEREEVGRRGRRLDETKPGTGLGLSIVSELASLYGGGVALSAAGLGGLRATLRLPAL